MRTTCQFFPMNASIHTCLWVGSWILISMTIAMMAYMLVYVGNMMVYVGNVMVCFGICWYDGIVMVYMGGSASNHPFLDKFIFFLNIIIMITMTPVLPLTTTKMMVMMQ